MKPFEGAWQDLSCAFFVDTMCHNSNRLISNRRNRSPTQEDEKVLIIVLTNPKQRTIFVLRSPPRFVINWKHSADYSQSM